MASLQCSYSSLLLTILLLLFSSISIAATIPEFDLANRKTTHLRFYLHNVLDRPNPTAVRVVTGPIPLYLINFGSIIVIDNAVTENPMLNTLVGRAQGIYVRASMRDVSIFMAMNIVFTGGKYNGSTLAVLTKNPFLQDPRELSVVGGTGQFRLAQGYAISRTYLLNLAVSNNSIHEYDVYIVHF